MKNKRGLSEVVTTLVLVLLVIVAIGVILMIIANFIFSKGDEINLSSIEVKMSINSIKADPSNPNNVIIRIERSMGGNIEGTNVILFNGVNSHTERIVSLNEGEEKDFSVSKGDLGIIKKVSVRPIFKLKSGKEKIGEVIASRDLTLEQSIQSIGGLVSWYRFEDNAEDIIGVNEGTCNAVTNTCPTYVDSGSNVRKKSASFDGVNDYVQVADSSSLDINGEEITLEAWVKPGKQKTDSSTAGGIILNKETSYEFAVRYDNSIQWALTGPTGKPLKENHAYTGTAWAWHIVNAKVNLNEWNHVVVTYKFPSAKTYLNSVLVEDFDVTPNSYSVSIIPSDYLLGIGARQHETSSWRSFFNGTIDEVMVFNRALTPEEVKSVYEITK